MERNDEECGEYLEEEMWRCENEEMWK